MNDHNLLWELFYHNQVICYYRIYCSFLPRVHDMIEYTDQFYHNQVIVMTEHNMKDQFYHNRVIVMILIWSM